MKRTLSLVLALVMILGTFTTVFAAEEVTALDLAAEVLEREGVLKGDGDDLMLEKNLLRRDMVVLVSRLMKAEDVAEDFPAEDLTFEDITDPHYNGYLAWSVANGIIEGHDEKTFGFNESVTVQDFAVVLLRVLGYEVTGHEPWKAAFADAKKLGLLDNVEVTEKDEVVRGVMAVMTFNALGTKMNDSDVTLAEFLGIEMPEAEVLEIKVYADNLKEIKIELNNVKLVNEEAIEDARNYRTDAGNVVDAELIDNIIVLTLEDAMIHNRNYELTTRYIRDFELSKEVFRAYDNQAPVVEDVTVLGTKGIRVRMSEPVQNASETDFLLNGRNLVMRVKHYGRDILLLPYREDATFPLGVQELTVGQLQDYAGFRSRSEDFEIDIVEDTAKPEVAKVIARNNSVIVEFKNEVHPDSVDKKNVSWTEVRGRHATEADSAVMLAGNKVEYKFNGNKQLPKPAATIKISGLENYSGYKMDAYEGIHDIEVDFSRPEIVNFKFTAKEVMEIEFNKALDDVTAEDVDNYVLNAYKVADKEFQVSKYAVDTVELLASENVVKVTFKAGTLVQGNEYRLDVSRVRDNTTLRNTMIADELEFTYGVGENLKVAAVRERSAEKIVLEFNKDLVRAEAEDLRNYEFKLDVESTLFRASDLSKYPSAILYGDGRTVEIRLPGNGRIVSEVHLGSSITALDGNRVLAGARVVNLGASYLDITKATLNAAGDKLTVEFNQKITMAPEVSNVTLAGTTGTLTVNVVSGKLEITGFTGVPTDVIITAGSSIATVYEVNAIASTNALTFDEIKDDRDLAILTGDLTAELNGSTLTITVELNKAIKAEEEKDIDILVNGKRVASLDKAVRAGKVYTYNYPVPTDVTPTTVRVTGMKMNASADVVDTAADAAALATAKTNLTNAISAAVLTTGEVEGNTAASVLTVNSLLDLAKGKANTALANPDATVATLVAALNALNESVADAKTLLLAKAAATLEAPTIADTTDASNIVITGISTATTATANGDNVTIATGAVALSTPLTDSAIVTLVVNMPATDDTLATELTFVYNVVENAGTFEITIQ